MSVRAIHAVVLILLLAGCAAADGPATPERMGRFVGLVARCGCSDLPPGRIVADYARPLAALYPPAELHRLGGFARVAAVENFSNQIPICAEVCAQTCAVNTVVVPLGGRPLGDGRSCVVTERDLRLTTGWTDQE